MTADPIEEAERLFKLATPGPWMPDTDEALKIKDKDGNSIALVMWTHLRGRRTEEEVIANAWLIAAAPLLFAKARRVEEMEKALRLAEQAITRVMSGRPESESAPTNMALGVVLDIIRAALSVPATPQDNSSTAGAVPLASKQQE